jgi:hypothetical protein
MPTIAAEAVTVTLGRGMKRGCRADCPNDIDERNDKNAISELGKKIILVCIVVVR